MMPKKTKKTPRLKKKKQLRKSPASRLDPTRTLYTFKAVGKRLCQKAVLIRSKGGWGKIDPELPTYWTWKANSVKSLRGVAALLTKHKLDLNVGLLMYPPNRKKWGKGDKGRRIKVNFIIDQETCYAVFDIDGGQFEIAGWDISWSTEKTAKAVFKKLDELFPGVGWVIQFTSSYGDPSKTSPPLRAICELDVPRTQAQIKAFAISQGWDKSIYTPDSFIYMVSPELRFTKQVNQADRARQKAYCKNMKRVFITEQMGVMHTFDWGAEVLDTKPENIELLPANDENTRQFNIFIEAAKEEGYWLREREHGKKQDIRCPFRDGIDPCPEFPEGIEPHSDITEKDTETCCTVWSPEDGKAPGFDCRRSHHQHLKFRHAYLLFQMLDYIPKDSGAEFEKVSTGVDWDSVKHDLSAERDSLKSKRLAYDKKAAHLIRRAGELELDPAYARELETNLAQWLNVGKELINPIMKRVLNGLYEVLSDSMKVRKSMELLLDRRKRKGTDIFLLGKIVWTHTPHNHGVKKLGDITSVDKWTDNSLEQDARKAASKYFPTDTTNWASKIIRMLNDEPNIDWKPSDSDAVEVFLTPRETYKDRTLSFMPDGMTVEKIRVGGKHTFKFFLRGTDIPAVCILRPTICPADKQDGNTLEQIIRSTDLCKRQRQLFINRILLFAIDDLPPPFNNVEFEDYWNFVSSVIETNAFSDILTSTQSLEYGTWYYTIDTKEKFKLIQKKLVKPIIDAEILREYTIQGYKYFDARKPEKIIPLLTGEGGSGKSTDRIAVRQIIPEKFIKILRWRTATRQFALQGISDHMIMEIDDIPKTPKVEEDTASNIKNLAGGYHYDESEGKHKDSGKSLVHFLASIFGNEIPRIGTYDSTVYTRFVSMSRHKPINLEDDDDMKRWYQEDASNTLAFAYRCYIEAMEQNQFKEIIKPVLNVDRRKIRVLQEDTDPLFTFAEDFIISNSNWNKVILLEDLIDPVGRETGIMITPNTYGMLRDKIKEAHSRSNALWTHNPTGDGRPCVFGQNQIPCIRGAEFVNEWTASKGHPSLVKFVQEILGEYRLELQEKMPDMGSGDIVADFKHIIPANQEFTVWGDSDSDSA